MKKVITTGALVAAMAVVGLSVAQPAAAQGQQNFGSHVSNCAHVMGGFSGAHNPSMMHPASGVVHSCQM